MASQQETLNVLPSRQTCQYYPIHFSLQHPTFAGPKAYYFKFTVPDGTGREHIEEASKAESSATDPEPWQNEGFTTTVQQELAKATKELTRTTTAAFLYGCGCIPPHRVLTVLKVLGTGIVWKHCMEIPYLPLQHIFVYTDGHTEVQ